MAVFGEKTVLANSREEILKGNAVEEMQSRKWFGNLDSLQWAAARPTATLMIP
jgi:hypothetical protein